MKVSKVLSVVVLAASITACGSRSANQNGTNINNQFSDPTIITTTPTNNTTNLPQAPVQSIQLSGGSGPSPIKYVTTPNTEGTLRIKVTAQSAPNLTVNGFQNWQFRYGCMSVDVVVNGITITTQPLKVPGVQQSQNSPCKDSPESEILDFSGHLTGNGPVQVKIQNAQYDNCRIDATYMAYYGSYAYQFYGCSMSNVWKNNMVAAKLQVQTEGYWMQ
jgi:hypothetical protein